MKKKKPFYTVQVVEVRGSTIPVLLFNELIDLISHASFLSKRKPVAIVVEALRKYGHQTDAMKQRSIKRYTKLLIKTAKDKRNLRST